MEQHALHWGKPLAEKTRAREPPTPGALASFVHSVHRKLWKSWLKLNTHPQVSVWVMEWPQRCSYWGWQSTKSFLRSRDHHAGLVHGCMAGMVGQDQLLVKKVWKLVSNDADFINIMNETFACDGSHVHSQRFDLKATQHYPQAFARVALEALRLP